MLSNAYFFTKFRFDTAENESAKNSQKFANNFPNFIQFCNPRSPHGSTGATAAGDAGDAAGDRAARPLAAEVAGQPGDLDNGVLSAGTADVPGARISK